MLDVFAVLLVSVGGAWLFGLVLSAIQKRPQLLPPDVTYQGLALYTIVHAVFYLLVGAALTRLLN